MSGRALRWHISLEKDVKTNWDALQKAMIAQWPAEQLKALPLENHNLKREGIIKIVRQSKELGYLGRHASGNTLGITISPIVEEAIRVLHRPSHSLAEFELLGSSNEIAFLGGTMMDAPSAYDYPSHKPVGTHPRDAALSAVGEGIHCSRVRDSRGRDCLSRSDIWTVNDTGRLQAYSPVNSNIQLKTCINTASGNIYLVDQDEPAKKATAEEAYSDVSLVFEETSSKNG